MKSAKGAISKPVGSTARAFFFYTITILMICMSLSVTFSLPITRTAKFTSFSDDKLGSRQSRYVYFWMHAQFNRKSGIFGLPIGSFQVVRSRPLSKGTKTLGTRVQKTPKRYHRVNSELNNVYQGNVKYVIHYMLSINEFSFYSFHQRQDNLPE